MAPRTSRTAAVAAIVALLAAGCAQPSDRPSGTPGGSGRAGGDEVQQAYAGPPLRFEANRGQTDPEVAFVSRGPGYTLFLTPAGFVLRLDGGEAPSAQGRPAHRAEGGAVLRMRLLGGQPQPQLAGVDELPGTAHYLWGHDPAKWVKDVPGYGRVRYGQVYPGIDLVFHGAGGRPEYDFVVAPGASPATIALALDGADRVGVDGEGNLAIETAAGPVRQPKPFVYQEVGGRRRRVPGGYTVDGGGVVRFRLGTYDPTRPLVIDPVLPYSTYLGGTADDGGYAIASDPVGNVYVTGFTGSLDFPTSNPAQAAYGGEVPASATAACSGGGGLGCGDAFVAKLNRAGSALSYATYLGGIGTDSGTSIAVDSAGSAYLTGTTTSPNFPTKDAFQPSLPAGGGGFSAKAFVAKLDPAGSALAYATYLGGNGTDAAKAIAVGPSGRAYVAGTTTSGNFPTKNAFQPLPARAADGDAFVATLDPAASGPASLLYSTYLGGIGADSGNGIAVDPSERAYVAGGTEAVDFPLKGPVQSTAGGGGDAFVAKLDPSASGPASLAHATYLGGLEADVANGIAVSPSGQAHVVGSTRSQAFPTKNPLQATRRGDADAFVARLDASGAALEYSTYLGGSDAEGTAIALDPSGNAYVTGTTRGPFPAKEALQPASGGDADAFVAKVDRNGSALGYSTYLGGAGEDSGRGISVDGSGSAFVTGYTGSGADFPTTNALRRFAGGERDAFVAKVAPADPDAPVVTAVEPRSGPVSGGTRVVIKGRRFDGATLVRFGNTSAPSFDVGSGGRRITLRTPPHQAGVATVTVSSRKGSSGAVPAATFTFARGAWSTLPGPARFGHAAAVLADGKVLVAGGCLTGTDNGKCATASATASLYDPARRGWAETGSMTVPRPDRAGASLTATLLRSGKVLVVSILSSEVYDPASGKWKRTAKPPLAGVGLNHTATLLPNGKVVAMDGATGGVALYDPAADAWAPSATTPRPGLEYHTATLLRSGQVLATGGGTTQLYDPAADRFTEVADMEIPRAYHTATLLRDGKVLVVGGRTETATAEPTASAEVFDPDAAPDPEHPEIKGVWRPVRGLSSPRYAHQATLLADGRVLVAGGSSTYGNRLPTAELYDPATGRWEAAGAMSTGRGGSIPAEGGGGARPGGGGRGVIRLQGGASFTASLLRDGTVLVVGGSDATAKSTGEGSPTGVTSALDSAELYDPDPEPVSDEGSGAGPTVAAMGAAGAAVALLAVVVIRRRRAGHRRAPGRGGRG